jgi:hypothetical protein
MSRLQAVFGVAIAIAGVSRADLRAARAEKNLEKRAGFALDNAEKMLSSAGDAYRQGEWEKTRSALQELRESVELAYESLRETGRSPRRNPKHFKRAEIKTRQLLRNLEDLRLKMGVEEREQVEPVRAYVEKVHDLFLEGIMGTGKWKKQP